MKTSISLSTHAINDVEVYIVNLTKNDSQRLKIKDKVAKSKSVNLRKCVICGNSFRSLYGAVACSQKCRDENRRKNKRCRARVMRGSDTSDHNKGARECVESSCRKLFQPDKQHPEQMYCSKKCRNKQMLNNPSASSVPSRERRNTANGWSLGYCPYKSGEIPIYPFGLSYLTWPVELSS